MIFFKIHKSIERTTREVMQFFNRRPVEQVIIPKNQRLYQLPMSKVQLPDYKFDDIKF